MIGKDIPAVCNLREIAIGTVSKEIYLKAHKVETKYSLVHEYYK